MHLQPSAATRHSILIVDDDLAARTQLRRLLAANGHTVIEAGNGRIARGLLADREIDLVLSDIFMPECDGFELIAAIRAMERPVPVIAMSDHESWTGLSFLDAANDLGAAAVIEKPFRADVLLRLLDAALLPAAQNARVVALGVLAEPEPNCVPSGLEWVGGRSAE
ncbi:response regulator [Dongia sedimenti]|uniref:Response regulator n=1 Tax=Dongia sedimenti TaxID=3064282 RepID=A0ABU0YN32_9PROT|nr:response regulator [Rhodospirillaceae bacterium R-7]